MLPKSPSFNLNLSNRNNIKADPSKSMCISPKNVTPLYFLKNPYRTLGTPNPRQKLFKRLSQEDSELFSREVEEELSPLTILTKSKMKDSNSELNDKNKKKKRTSFLDLPTSTSKARTPGKKDVPVSNESSALLQDSTAREKTLELNVIRNLSKASASKENKELVSTPKSGSVPKIAQFVMSHSPLGTFEGSPLASGNRKMGDGEPLLSLFGRARTEKGLVNINVIKTAPTNVLGNAIRRKSCHCSECGGMSSLEKKHMNIAIPPKRALKNKQEKSRSPSRRMSKLVKSPSCLPETTRKKPVKLLNSVSQGFKGQSESISTPFLTFGNAVAAVQRGSFNVAAKKDPAKELDPVRRSLRGPENKNMLDDKPSSGRNMRSFRLQGDEIITAKSSIKEENNTDASSIMTSHSGSPAILSARNSRLEPEKEYKLLPFMKLTLVEQTMKEDIGNKESPRRAKGADIDRGSVSPRRLVSPKAGTLKPGPFKLEDKQIRDVYNVSFSGLQVTKKIMNHSLKTSPRAAAKYPVIQGESQYMLPSPSSFSREESAKKKKKGETDRSHDPYHMGSLSTRSFAIKHSNTSRDRSKLDKSRDISEEKSAGEGLMPLQIKLGKIVTTPLLSDRAPRTIDFSAVVGKSTTSIERTPKNRVEKPEKPKKLRRRLKGHNFAALGLDKIMKAYESFEVLPSLKLKDEMGR